MSNGDRSGLQGRSRGQQCDDLHEIMFPHRIYASSARYDGDDWQDGEFPHGSSHPASPFAVYQAWPNSAAARFSGHGFDIELSPAVELRGPGKSRHA